MSRYTFASPRPGLPPGLQRVLNLVLLGSLGLNAWLLVGPGGGPAPDGAPETAEAAMVNAVQPAAPAPAVATAPAPAAAAAPEAIRAGGWDGLARLDLEVDGSLAQVFAGNLEGRRADWLTATTSRLLVWEMDVTSDLRRGDRLQVLYDPVEGGQEGEVRIAALRLSSQKLGRDLRAYFYARSGARFGDWYDESGAAIASRLKNQPMREYQQITSLLRDGRRHKGVDFTAPVGTEVVLPFDGTITRVNWNWKANGNCIEVRYKDGVHAKFLHLNEVKPAAAVGKSLKAGTVIALSGNTGHSNAPHLHYQLNQGPDGKVVDPLEYHGLTEERLAGPDLAAFAAVRGELEAALEGRAAAPATAAAPAAGASGG